MRELTAEEFELLLARLDPDRERAGAAYVEVRCRLTRFFEWRGCDAAEDLADDTLNRAARRLARGLEPVNLHGFFFGIAKLVYKEYVRRQDRERKAIEAERMAGLALQDPEQDRWLDCIRDCLARLPEDQRQLILRYHVEVEEDRIRLRQELADELGIGPNALRIRAHRVRRALEECVRRCLERRR